MNGFMIRDDDCELMTKLDQFVDWIRETHPGGKVSRESTARQLLHAALRSPELMRQVAGSAPPAPR